MTSRFDDRFQNHGSPVVDREFSVSITFSRGGITTAAFSARRSQRSHESMGGEIGISVRVERRDFLLPIADVMIDGTEVEPRAGDRITEGSTVWEVHFPDDTTPAAEKLGEYDWVAHTKLVS